MQSFNPELNAISTAILIGLLQGISIIVLFRIKGFHRDHSYFLLFLGFLVLIQFESFLLRSGYIIHLLFFFNISVPLVLGLGPMLYAYTQKSLHNKFYRLWFFAHLVPFFFYLAYSFAFFLQPNALKYNAYIKNYQPRFDLMPVRQSFESDPWNIQGWVVVELLSVHLLIYSVLSLVSIYRNDERVRDPGKTQWLAYLNGILMAGSIVLFLSQGGVVNGYVFFKSPFPSFAPDLWITLVMYAITGYLLVRPEPFRQANPRYQKSVLSSDFKKINLERLRTLMDSDKPYLSPDFSLEKLSKLSGITKHQLSQILNEELNLTFYELTHQYRIEEAKQILKTSEHIKMEYLANQLGYRSKATFFSTFKKATGLTPVLFKESQQ